MDTLLLSKMVRELILDHDRVELPGLGTFVADLVPASFSDRGYTINPPYRRLSFHQIKNGDTLLVDFYAKTNNIAIETARVILVQFISDLKEKLTSDKTVVFPGLGRLRATKENNFFFVSNEDLDIFPEGIGLQPISLKTHTESQEEIADSVITLTRILSPVSPSTSSVSAEAESEVAETAAAEIAEVETVCGETESEAAGAAADIHEVESATAEAESEAAETAAAEITEAETVSGETEIETDEIAATAAVDAETETCEPEEEPSGISDESPAAKNLEATDPAPVQTKKKKSGFLRFLKGLLKTVLILAIIAAIALAAFLILAQTAPDFIDSILYTPEELRIINY